MEKIVKRDTPILVNLELDINLTEKKLCSYLHTTFVPNDGEIDDLVNEFNKKFEQEKNKTNPEIGKRLIDVFENQVKHLKKAVEE